MAYRLLLLRRSSFGDILHLMPTLCALAKTFPSWTFHHWIKPSYEAILSSNPWATPRTSIQKDETYDLMIDFQGLGKTALKSRFIPSLGVVGYGGREIREWPFHLLYHRAIHTGKEHIVLRHLQLASLALGYTLSIPSDYRLDWFPTPPKEDPLEGVSPPILLVLPFSSQRKKDLPLEDWQDILRELHQEGWKLLLAWGPQQETLAKAWQERLPFLQTLPLLPLRELAWVIQKVSCVLAPDTGPLHLADQLRIPVMGQFFRFSPERNGPIFSPSFIFYREKPNKNKVKLWLSSLS